METGPVTVHTGRDQDRGREGESKGSLAVPGPSAKLIPCWEGLKQSRSSSGPFFSASPSSATLPAAGRDREKQLHPWRSSSGFLTRGKDSSPRSCPLGTAHGLLLWQQNHCCLCPGITPPALCLLRVSQGGCGMSQLP